MRHGERFNSVSHLIGSVLAVAGLGVLSTIACLRCDWERLAAFGVYGFTLVLLYVCSTLYHSSSDPKRKRVFQIMDHAAIYLLIAGSYTPIALVTLAGTCGALMLGTVWGLAIVGIAQEFAWGRKSTTRWLSLAIYIFMGCLAFFAMESLWKALPAGGLACLFGAGAAYLTGIYFYLNDHRPHYHGIWHMFVLAGSASHFLCLLLYVA